MAEQVEPAGARDEVWAKARDGARALLEGTERFRVPGASPDVELSALDFPNRDGTRRAGPTPLGRFGQAVDVTTNGTARTIPFDAPYLASEVGVLTFEN